MSERICLTLTQSTNTLQIKVDRLLVEEWTFLTSVYTEVTVVLVQGLQGGDVGCPLHYLIHPFDGTDHLIAFRLGKHWRPFMLGNLSCSIERVKERESSGLG